MTIVTPSSSFWLSRSEIPSYNLVIPALLDKGMANLKEACSLTPGRFCFDSILGSAPRAALTSRPECAGIPLKPMLAKPTKAITEVLDRFEGKRFTCEYKYDGERAQVRQLYSSNPSAATQNDR